MEIRDLTRLALAAPGRLKRAPPAPATVAVRDLGQRAIVISVGEALRLVEATAPANIRNLAPNLRHGVLAVALRYALDELAWPDAESAGPDPRTIAAVEFAAGVCRDWLRTTKRHRAAAEAVRREREARLAAEARAAAAAAKPKRRRKSARLNVIPISRAIRPVCRNPFAAEEQK